MIIHWNYLSNKFFLRNFFVAIAVDDEDEPAVEHVSVVNISSLTWLVFSVNIIELGWTNFGIIGNNLISFGRVLCIWSKFVEDDVNSHEFVFVFEVFCCFEHQ